MKSFLLSLLLGFSIVAAAQSKDEKAIYKLLQDQVVAWNNADLESFMQGYWKNDSLMFIGKSGVTYGWQNTLGNYKTGYPNKAAMGDFTSTVIQMKKLSKKYYSVTGKWYLKRTIGDATGHYTLILKKIGGKWYIISDHSS